MFIAVTPSKQQAIHSIVKGLLKTLKKLMPTYEVYIHCVLCAGEHRLLMRVHLDDGPDRKQTVTEFFPEGLLPPQILAIRGHDALCLKTGKKFKLENDDQLLLVPTAFVETRLG